jgi:predicted GTPase
VVVVVGPPKAGKSSLVNALLGRPGLSPVATRLATNVPIEFVTADAPYASVHRHSDPIQDIALDALGDWVTERGNPGNERGVRSVEVGVDSPLLEDVTFVDTPGAHGAEGDHLALTLMALGLADALLFVTDAGREISASALDFLRKAAQRIDTVVIAVTKSDSFRGSREVLAADRRLLAEHEPRFANAPLVLVSSVLAERAMAVDGAIAAELREESGIDRLEALLYEHVAARGNHLATANAIQLAATVLVALERRLAETHAAILSGADAGPAIDQELQRLEAEVDEAATWRPRLEEALRTASREWLDTFKSDAVRLAGTFGERARSTSASDTERLFQGLDEDLTSAVTRLMHATSNAIAEIVERIVGGIERGSRLEDALTDLPPEARIRTGRPGHDRSTKMIDEVLGALRRAPGATTGIKMLFSNMGWGSLGGPHVAAATVVVSSAYLLVQRRRTASALRERLESAVHEEVQRAVHHVSDAYRRHLETLRREIVHHVEDCVGRRVHEVEQLRRVGEEAMRQAAVERERHLAELSRDLDQVRSCAWHAEALLREA